MSAKRAILVGAGGMGRTWARNLTENPKTTVAAWVDINAEQVSKGIEEVGLSNVVSDTNLDRVLKDVEADFVVDVSTPESHHDVTIRSLESGLPVIGEKPMADSMDHARLAVEACDRTGLLYMVSQSRRYDGRIRAFHELIKSSLGPVQILNADFYLGPHFGGFRELMDHVLLLDMAIHTFDQARLLSGADPISVYCEEYNPEWSWYAGAASADASFEMSGGLRFSYRGCWCSEGRHTSWESDWRAVGGLGSATWDGFESISAEVVEKPDGFFSKMKSIDVKPYSVDGGIKGSLNDFLHALDSGAKPMGECHDNIKSLAMVFGAIASAEQGSRVKMSEL